jgi:addiction module RelE/StbE family toxin
MAQVVYSEQAFADLERLVDFLAENDQKAALETLITIQEAVSILERHPLIGRSCEQDLRELVISRGRTGYVALYDFLETDDAALVLAIRHQREAGYIE